MRLKYGYVVGKCTGFTKDADGKVIEVQAEYLPETRSGTPGADSVKVKGNITWISAAHAVPATVHLYDRLFADPHPDAGDKDFLACLNPDSRQTVQAWLEPGTVAEPGAPSSSSAWATSRPTGWTPPAGAGAQPNRDPARLLGRGIRGGR